MRSFLLALLALDILQLAVAAAAAFLGWRRLRLARSPERVEEERAFHRSHAQYGFSHALLLGAGSLVLAIPVVLGLARVIGYWTAIAAALACELVVLPVARTALWRMEQAHVRRVTQQS